MNRRPLTVVLAGTRSFGAAVGRLLVAWRARDVQLLAVSCPDARPDGSPDPLHRLAEAEGLRWIPAGELRAETLPEGTDLIVAAHSHDFIGRRTRLRARFGAIGYHPSLLPRHRGRDAVRWTVRMRDPIAGGTVFWLGDSVDAGPIATQDWCHVGPTETAEELWRDKLFPMGVRLIERVLDDLQAGRIVQVPQDERHATWEPSWERPPMFRPELTLIGPGLEGFEVIRERTECSAPR